MSYSDDEDQPSLESLTQNLSRTRCSTTFLNGRETKCCCGRDDCSFTRRSQAMLAELETDVQIAAKLGQALLHRHETSMAETDREREKMAHAIASLEDKINELEFANSRTTDANKSLLGTLEDANINMCLGESRIRELQEELDVVHKELTRISATAARTEVLETQLAVLEGEQEELRNTVTTTKAEERAAVARWKKAERSLKELEQQVERIEMENSLEKARSRNLLDRLEQKRVVDPKTGHSSPTALQDRTQLSRFMKEILAENGHLQIGITELRDMLMASQEEVNRLREQLEEVGVQKIERDRSPLSQELGRSPSAMQTIVHHHHYHVPPTKEKGTSKPTVRRTKKRRGPEHFLPLEQNGNSPPSAISKRWSVGSRATSGAASSVITSPVSTFRESSIFDHASVGPESSRPSSADSNYHPPPVQPKRSSTSSSKYARRSDSSFGIPPFSILHTTEEVPSDHDFSPPISPVIPATKLRRAASHESMLSIMDLNLTTTSFPVSPAQSSSNSAQGKLKRTPTFSANVTPHHAQASVTRGMAIRSQSTGSGSSAYSRLLGLHQEGSVGSSPPAQRGALSRKGSEKGTGWFWRWGGGRSPSEGIPSTEVVVQDGGSTEVSGSETARSGGSVRVGGRKIMSRPSVLSGYFDEDLLKESLGEAHLMLG